MITGVRDVYYNVSNMDRSLRFYCEGLGLSIASSNEFWSALTSGGVTIGLHWSEGSPVPVLPKDRHGAHAGATLTLRSTDVPGDRLRLEQAGAVVLSESVQPWGHMLVFEDPDGNVLKLMNPDVLPEVEALHRT
jgi:catechol 2,3-dioxygenase-like lactoylglutathione lyase family enzyme